MKKKEFDLNAFFNLLAALSVIGSNASNFSTVEKFAIIFFCLIVTFFSNDNDNSNKENN